MPIGFLLLVLFCLEVIRRQGQRISLLLIILIPFIAAAIISEQGARWEGELASVLWEGEWWPEVEFGGKEVALEDSEGLNLEESEDAEEENWREQLRMQQWREKRIEERLRSRREQGSSLSGIIGFEFESSSSGESESSQDMLREAETMPSRLPKSGFGFGSMGIVLLAGYCGTLHNRARKRAQQN